MTGRIKSYNPSTRFGFITSGNEDYRFHFKDWTLRLPPTKGLIVEFEPYQTEKGWRAREITHL